MFLFVFSITFQKWKVYNNFVIVFSFLGGINVKDKIFEKSKIEIFDLEGNDIIVTSFGIPLPDEEFDEE